MFVFSFPPPLYLDSKLSKPGTASYYGVHGNAERVLLGLLPSSTQRHRRSHGNARFGEAEQTLGHHSELPAPVLGWARPSRDNFSPVSPTALLAVQTHSRHPCSGSTTRPQALVLPSVTKMTFSSHSFGCCVQNRVNSDGVR